ncbi:hypothetical protein ACFU8I_14305 [Streptomyces sp. NPDC057540]|uniref:hypothetical protein n=1 Tax=Streptomyces sp. NPDC057540 TaxID=3346160 RepID=UPI0036979232
MSSAGVNGVAGGIHRFVVFGDICGSGTLDMAEKGLHRAAMYAAFDEAYGSVGVEPGTFHQEDRGDGILAALRPDVPPTLMVGRWIDTLYESLRAHNKGRSRRLRLRIGMNAGLVAQDAHGLVGRAVDLAARLCDSAPARRIMAESPDVDLLVVVSDWLYGNVVAEGGRYVEPAHYRPARIRSKETDETAWFHVPRRTAPPLTRGGGGGRPAGGGRGGPGGGAPRGGGGGRGGAPPPPPGPGAGTARTTSGETCSTSTATRSTGASPASARDPDRRRVTRGERPGRAGGQRHPGLRPRPRRPGGRRPGRRPGGRARPERRPRRSG